MKQVYLLIVALMTMTAAYATAPTTTVMLQHKGNVTFYEPDSIAAAIRESVDGDTIFLNEGTFPGFTIDKKITVRGVGNSKTIIAGQIKIDIPTPDLTATLLEGLYLYSSNGGHNIYTYCDLDGLKIKKCSFDYLWVSGKNTKLTNLIIDRCYIWETFYTYSQPRIDYTYYNNYVMSATITNTVIKTLKSEAVTSSDIVFMNCNIYSFNYSENFRGTIMNSIINATPTLRECSLINTLLKGKNSIENSVHQNNCYFESNDLIPSNQLVGKYNVDELTEKGYLGNDGTVVGVYGGSNPYTLDLQLPRVASHTLNVDNAHKTLNVTVKLSE